MKIFVTGGTGFIGSHFLNQAHAAGHEIVALRRSPDSVPRIPLTKEPVWVDKAMNQVTADDLEGCDALVHLAAFGATPQPATWQSCFKINVVDSLHLVESANTAGVARIIAAGSYAEYGASGPRYEFIPLDAPLEPKGPYAASKAAFFMALRAFTASNSMRLAYGRIFSAYGEGQYEKNLWPSLRLAAKAGENFEMTHGEQIRDFIAVERVAAWFVESLVQEKAFYIANVASGEPVMLADFCRYWWKQFGAKGQLKFGALPYRDNEVMRYVPEV